MRSGGGGAEHVRVRAGAEEGAIPGLYEHNGSGGEGVASDGAEWQGGGGGGHPAVAAESHGGLPGAPPEADEATHQTEEEKGNHGRNGGSWEDK